MQRVAYREMEIREALQKGRYLGRALKLRRNPPDRTKSKHPNSPKSTQVVPANWGTCK